MGHISKTPAGTYRANWRDVTGRQKAKSFRTKKAAAGFLAQVESALHRGVYVDPHAGRQSFGPYAARWLAARTTEKTTTARDASIMRANVLPRWADVPIGRIDHLAVQRWVTELSERLAPATVAVCLRMLSNVLRSACRDRIIGANPCEGVKVPKNRRKDTDSRVITPDVLTDRLMPAIPIRHRALIAVAGGTGLRWGECVGLRWDAVDLNSRELHVVRVAVEVAGTVTSKPFPKSRAGRRTVPVPDFVVAELERHREEYAAGPAGEVFRNSSNGPLRRTLFRARVWRPALVRAGLLGDVAELEPDRWRASWPDATGAILSAEFTTEPDAVRHVAKTAAGGLRFHDLRHSYATWLVSRGLPVNDVQRVMGHERASTTLDMYTHASNHGDDHIRAAFADDSLTPEPETAHESEDPDQDDDSGELAS
jgi:integrase